MTRTLRFVLLLLMFSLPLAGCGLVDSSDGGDNGPDDGGDQQALVNAVPSVRTV